MKKRAHTLITSKTEHIKRQCVELASAPLHLLGTESCEALRSHVVRECELARTYKRPDFSSMPRELWPFVTRALPTSDNKALKLTCRKIRKAVHDRATELKINLQSTSLAEQFERLKRCEAMKCVQKLVFAGRILTPTAKYIHDNVRGARDLTEVRFATTPGMSTVLCAKLCSAYVVRWRSLQKLDVYVGSSTDALVCDKMCTKLAEQLSSISIRSMSVSAMNTLTGLAVKWRHLVHKLDLRRTHHSKHLPQLPASASPHIGLILPDIDYARYYSNLRSVKIDAYCQLEGHVDGRTPLAPIVLPGAPRIDITLRLYGAGLRTHTTQKQVCMVRLCDQSHKCPIFARIIYRDGTLEKCVFENIVIAKKIKKEEDVV